MIIPNLSGSSLSGSESKGILQFKDEDSRLNQKITISIQRCSLAEALNELHRQTGVNLTCSRTCEEQKIQLHLENQPLVKVMAALEELLPGCWITEQKDYSKWRYQFQVDEEALKKQKQWWIDTEELINIVDNLRKEYQRTHLDEALDQAINYKPNLENEGLDIGPLTQQAARVVKSLPNEYKEEIIQQMKFREQGLYAPENPERWVAGRVLPFNTQVALAPMINLHNTILGDEIGKIDINDNEIHKIINQSKLGFTNTNGIIKLYLKIPGERKMVRSLIAHLEIPNLLYLRSYYHDTLPSLVNIEIKDLERQYGKRATQLIEKLARVHRTTFWPSDTPSDLPSMRLMFTYQETQDLKKSGRLSDILGLLAKKTGIPIISDYYTQYRRSLPNISNMDFNDLLNLLSKGFDYSWKYSQGVLLWRNNRWYRDDAFEIPNKWLDRWIVHLIATNFPEKKQLFKPNLDVYTEMVTVLTQDQIRIGLRASSNREKGLWVLVGRDLQLQKSLLLFYSSLYPNQKEQIKSVGVPIIEMNNHQQEALVKALEDEVLVPNLANDSLLSGTVRVEYQQEDKAWIRGPFRLVVSLPSP